MNYLVIGNGFDLAHGLPTTYQDFLSFVDSFLVRAGEKTAKEEKTYISNAVDEYLCDLLSSVSKEEVKNEYLETLNDNSWIRHFNRVNIKNGWIDFEAEISRVIQTLDAAREYVYNQVKDNREEYRLEQWHCDVLKHLLNNEKLDCHYYSVTLDFFRLFPDRLYSDLNRLTRALELYLSDCVNSIRITDLKSDILDNPVDYLISFNYTNTYERVYKPLDASHYDYLHGKARVNSSIDECNLVLGIDEYLSKPACDTDNEYIKFKKFFQRIYKRTGCEYVKWIERMEKNPLNKRPKTIEHHIYIYGHSLDITDKDILSRLIRIDNMKTTIFYYSKEAYANQIANLVKVLGEENLIGMVYGDNPAIRFIQQNS